MTHAPHVQVRRVYGPPEKNGGQRVLVDRLWPRGLSKERADADGPQRHGFTCAHCGRAITTSVDGLFHNPQHGSPQRFCGHACRQAAYRRRQTGVAENTPPQQRGGQTRTLTARSTGQLGSQFSTGQIPVIVATHD